MFGVLNIRKPAGLTSHDVVGIVRKILKIKQVGHTGTLDPFAQGVLPICVGKATRLIEYFDDDKEYLATVQFGTATTTYDIEGEVTQKSEDRVDQNSVLVGLEKFRGEISQLPPIYSAIKVNGKKLYEYARNNEKVNIEPRKVFIGKIEIKSFNKDLQQAEILISCSKGTYIRSIANDLGENLGCFGHLVKLERVRAGRLCIENSIDLPIELIEQPTAGKAPKYKVLENAEQVLMSNIVSPIELLPFEKFELNEVQLKKILNGNAINVSQEKINRDDFLILVYNNEVKAIGQFTEKQIKVRKVFI